MGRPASERVELHIGAVGSQVDGIPRGSAAFLGRDGCSHSEGYHSHV